MSAAPERPCAACGGDLDPDDQLVLARGRRRLHHCSEACLAKTLRAERIARGLRRRRAIVSGSVLALVLAGVWTVRRHHARPPRSISLSWPGAWDKTPPPEQIYFGPAWPPTDSDWTFAFERARWVYPLPGPERRAPAADDHIFAPDALRKRVTSCRAPGVCAVTLGGELWGEHVYAALDGVVDHAQGRGNDEHGGGYVRIAHFGGMVFTEYFHLAAVPRGIVRGAHVAAGEVIGLLGDTGVGPERASADGRRSRAHLHFALAIRPRADLPEIYWDPGPLMADWPMHVPPHGTVAGLMGATNAMEIPRRHRSH